MNFNITNQATHKTQDTQFSAVRYFEENNETISY